MGENRLRLAIGAALAEVVIQLAVLVAAGTLGGAPLRVVFLAAKVPFCLLARRRNAGAFLALWVYEFAAVAAAVAVDGPGIVRGGFAFAALMVMVLLGRATSAFPPVEWKSR
jgi:hypothetical protein